MSQMSFPRSIKLSDSHNENDSFSWLKIDAIGMFFNKENKEAAEKLLEAIELRKKYIDILNSKTAKISQSSKPSPHSGSHSPELPSFHHHHRNQHHQHHNHDQEQRAFAAVVTAASPDPLAEWRRGSSANDYKEPWNSGSQSRPQVISTRIALPRDDDGEEDFIGSAPSFRSIASIAERFESHVQNSGKKATEKVLAAIPMLNAPSLNRGTKPSESDTYLDLSTSPDDTFMLSPPLSGKNNEAKLSGKIKLVNDLGDTEGSPSLEDIESQLGIGEEEIKSRTDAFIKNLPDYVDFIKDKEAVLRICTNGPVVSYSRSRLNILDYKFTFYKLLNSDYECVLLKNIPADRTTVARVDTHVHLSSAMGDKHLLDFIINKFDSSPDDIVWEDKGQKKTLKDLFDTLGLDKSKLNVHVLDLKAGSSSKKTHGDHIRAMCNPTDVGSLRYVFLRINNPVKGKYYAEIAHEVFENIEKSNKKTEYRISIYGRTFDEWDHLAEWADKFDVHSPNNRWVIQFPRVYESLHKAGFVKNFQEYLDNIFKPLYEVTINPRKSPKLDKFLKDVSGFDSVEDESKVDHRLKKIIPPEMWTDEQSPPYSYYSYYFWRSISILNFMRSLRGMVPFTFRPHSGEGGNNEHMVSSFLIASGVNHGIVLTQLPGLEYLYYLCKIGISISPLSNNDKFMDYKDNPFPVFFRRGLNVALSTDAPLLFHFTERPLLEEYAIASRFWKLSEADLSELFRNSVIQSGFSEEEKVSWLGPDYMNKSNPDKTNLPEMRVQYRNECFKEEHDILIKLTSSNAHFSHSMPHYMGLDYSTMLEYNTINSAANAETLATIPLLREAYALRKKYEASWVMRTNEERYNWPAVTTRSEHAFSLVNGVYNVYESKDVLCSNDETELATVRCDTCGRSFCKECFYVLHKAPSKKLHKFTEHPPQRPLYKPIPFKEFVTDFNRLAAICEMGPCRTLCWKRNHILEKKFHFHRLLNEKLEDSVAKKSGADFYSVTKVDNHIHINRMMTAPRFLDFIKDKLETEPNTIVFKTLSMPAVPQIAPVLSSSTNSLLSPRSSALAAIAAASGNYAAPGGSRKEEEQHEVVMNNVTVKELFEALGIEIESLNLDGLSVQADNTTFMRFDKLVRKYNPYGKKELQKVFLSMHNDIEGRFLAELLKQTVFNVENADPSIKFETRVSIYGSGPKEVEEVAHFMVRFGLLSPNNRWIIQIPRTLPQLFERNGIKNFGQVLMNIFGPLFEATRDPAAYPEIDAFLRNVGGFDSIGDESERDYRLIYELAKPYEWERPENPPYAYWMYYINANLHALNAFRRSRGMNVFDFVPHSGQTGDFSHLVAGYLTATHIVHGTTLMSHPVLSYLYYISQVGITLSPLSESSVHVLCYDDDPFPAFFRRGLNVTLSTDSPLLQHRTEEPLIEEYALAFQSWKLSLVDMYEIARNSVINSSFAAQEKEEWIGKKFWSAHLNKKGFAKHSSVPSYRLQFRAETLQNEKNFLELK